MIQSNKIFRAHLGCWDYGSTDEPKYSKNQIFTFFNRFDKKNPNISIQCKANEKQVSEQTNANVGVFFCRIC
jgi:hypothetical protein